MYFDYYLNDDQGTLSLESLHPQTRLTPAKLQWPQCAVEVIPLGVGVYHPPKIRTYITERTT